MQGDVLVDALSVELILRTAELQRSFSTIYIGGGTPTVLETNQLESIFGNIRKRLIIEETAEFTMEANPNSLSEATLVLLREQGVNRISIGVQSFSSEILSWLGRQHRAADVERAVDMVRQCGFSNISIDLIYGIPGLSREQWCRTLELAIALSPTHISAYSLSIDQGSRLYTEASSDASLLPDDSTAAEQYEDTVTILERAGYRQYEVSNFSKPSFECRHNLNYWDRREYIGMGPGAWSFSGERRRRNIADTSAYAARLERNQLPVDFEETLDESQAQIEALFLGLRRTCGIDIADYSARFGAAERIFTGSISRLEGTGLAVIEKGHLHLTQRGMLLSDEVLSRIIS